MLRARPGSAPIAWWNDDLEELSDDVRLEECLRQASEAGFTGMETGRRFPMNMDELGPVLDRFGVSICGGWFPDLLPDGDMEADKDPIRWQRCMVHFYRNVFSHVPSGKIREVTHMLKAIHAQENRAAAQEKADAVIAGLHRQRLGKAADLVERHIGETLTYYTFPDSHWIKIRTGSCPPNCPGGDGYRDGAPRRGACRRCRPVRRGRRFS